MRICTIDGCERKHFGLSYCQKHYRVLKGYGDANYIKPVLYCKIEGCNGIHDAKGYCGKHILRFRLYGDPNFVMRVRGDGRKKNPLYVLYRGMKGRITKVNAKQYKDYGGRGITICDRWLGIHGFNNFCNDMGPRPEGYSIDRIDVNGNYEPSNCRRATRHQQAANTRNNNKVVGVVFHKKYNKRRASITINRKYIGLGSYEKYEDAVKARRDAENIYGVYK